MDDTGRIKANPRITALKLDAEIFCKRMGLNPEQTMPVPHPTVAGVMMQIPLWYNIAGQMFELRMMLVAMKDADTQRRGAANDAGPPPAGEPSRIVTP